MPTATAEKTDDFVHLHVHTEFSMLDGAARIGDLMEEVVRQGQHAIATTDHGYLFGAHEFWGQESDDVSARGAYTHMTLLSKNNTGMHNLFRASSLASLEGQMGKWPRMDRELLETYGEGLMATTGCPSGEVQTRIRLGQWDEAVRAAGELQDLFGRENYYVELMDHGIEIETRVTKDLLRLAEAIGAPLVATNDLHYVRQEDAASQEALLAINSGSTLDDPD